MTEVVNVVGGGLAGVEAAWQAAELGATVRLYEMRPVLQTPAHRTDKLAEIVCSNSLKTDEPGSAPYLLKEELRRGNSLVLHAAEATRVPAGAALSVDRIRFAEIITERVERHPNIEVVREEFREIPAGTPSVLAIPSEGTKEKNSPPYEGGVAAASADGGVLSTRHPESQVPKQRENHPAEAAPLLRKEGSSEVRSSEVGSSDVRSSEVRSSGVGSSDVTIIATGPLTSDALTKSIMKWTGDDQLYFYDAIAPIVAADSIDMSIAFKAARYDKGGDDYINCPMNREQYETFINELLVAKSVPLKRFEETRWFESCLPIEEIARRGVDTLRFGPMKPKGLRDPKTGYEPYACVQLRQENLMADAFGLVGFQNHLRYGEQARVLRLIPGLENAEFLQFGQIHRNTFINSPKILNEDLATRKDPRLFFAGQITGVEGYVESVATGWLAGINAVRVLRRRPMLTAPSTSAIGALCRYVSNVETKNFQPVNITFGLIEELPLELRKKYRNKRERHMVQVERALLDWDEFMKSVHGEAKVLAS